jgi:hypothetical protein
MSKKPYNSNSDSLTVILLRIDSSLFLSKEQKTALREIAPKLAEEQLKELNRLLDGEDDTIALLLSEAASKGGKKALTPLDSYLHGSMKDLRRLEERAESIQQQGDAESSLDHALSP